jgi:hypothetical protein
MPAASNIILLQKLMRNYTEQLATEYRIARVLAVALNLQQGCAAIF